MSFCIKVRYPASGNMQYMLRNPIIGDDGKSHWALDYLDLKKGIFNSLDSCISYIKSRYTKDFNKPYTYFVYSLDENNVEHLENTFNVVNIREY